MMGLNLAVGVIRCEVEDEVRRENLGLAPSIRQVIEKIVDTRLRRCFVNVMCYLR